MSLDRPPLGVKRNSTGSSDSSLGSFALCEQLERRNSREKRPTSLSIPYVTVEQRRLSNTDSPPNSGSPRHQRVGSNSGNASPLLPPRTPSPAISITTPKSGMPPPGFSLDPYRSSSPVSPTPVTPHSRHKRDSGELGRERSSSNSSSNSFPPATTSFSLPSYVGGGGLGGSGSARSGAVIRESSTPLHSAHSASLSSLNSSSSSTLRGGGAGEASTPRESSSSSQQPPQRERSSRSGSSRHGSRSQSVRKSRPSNEPSGVHSSTPPVPADPAGLRSLGLAPDLPLPPPMPSPTLLPSSQQPSSGSSSHRRRSNSAPRSRPTDKSAQRLTDEVGRLLAVPRPDHTSSTSNGGSSTPSPWLQSPASPVNLPPSPVLAPAPSPRAHRQGMRLEDASRQRSHFQMSLREAASSAASDHHHHHHHSHNNSSGLSASASSPALNATSTPNQATMRSPIASPTPCSSSSSSLQVPPILSLILQFLEDPVSLNVAGLHRVATEQSKILNLVALLDSEAVLPPSLTCLTKDHHLVSGLLKHYLKELPEPVVTRSLYPRLLTLARELWTQPGGTISHHRAQELYRNSLKDVLRKILPQELPRVHLIVLRRLLDYFRAFLRHSSTNQMTPDSLSTVFAPVLFPVDQTSAQYAQDLFHVRQLIHCLMEHPV